MANYNANLTNSKYVVADAKSTWSAAHDATTGDTVYTLTAAVHNAPASGFLASNYYVRRLDLQFDTSAASGVSAAKLWVYIPSSGGWDTDGYTVELLDNTNNANLSATLATEDFNDFGTTSIGSKDLTLLTNIGGWVSIDLSNLSAINEGGTTRIGVRLSGDISNSTPSGYNTLRIDATTNTPYLELTEGATDTVTLTDVTDGRIIQRNASNEGSLTISGTYSGTPTAIQARIVEDGTSTEVVTWTTIDASPSAGTFSGTLSNIPDGGWYNVQVRFSNDTGVTDAGTNKVGVGILIGYIGQSLALQMSTIGATVTPNALTRKYNGSWVTNTGDGAITMANELVSTYGVPVGILNYAADGSCLLGGLHGTDWWLNFSTMYTSFTGAVTAVGGYLEYIIWSQGHCDAYYGGTAYTSSYKTGLGTLLTQLRSDVSCYQGTLPMLIDLLGRWTGGGYDAEFQAFRTAQEEFANETSGVYISGTYQDLPMADTAHLTNVGYIALGQREAQTIKYLLGTETYYEGVKIANFRVVNNNTIKVSLTHSGGNNFTPTTAITAFEVLDNGAAETISSAVQQNANSIQLTVSGTLDGTVTVRYLYGNTTDVGNLVFDNSTLTLPMRGNPNITEDTTVYQSLTMAGFGGTVIQFS